jgi:hypothetical protein
MSGVVHNLCRKLAMVAKQMRTGQPDTGRRIINDRLLTPAEHPICTRCEVDLYDDIVKRRNRALSEYRAAVYDCVRKAIRWM